MVVTYSNMYVTSKNKVGNLTKEEMKNFFAIFSLSGYVPLPSRRIYCENSVHSRNELIPNALSRNSFKYIFSNLHCCDKFTKGRALILKMNKSFQEYAPLREHHSVDEAIVPYFGRHGCKKFIRGKPIRYGYKVWTGTTSEGYVIRVEPYQGAKCEIDPKYKECGLGPSVILQYVDIITGLEKQPYHLFCDILLPTSFCAYN